MKAGPGRADGRSREGEPRPPTGTRGPERVCGATHGTPRVAQQPCAGPKGPVGSHVLAERGGRWQLGPTDPKPGAWARAPLMAEGRHPQYLSKGRGLPRRLDTTASQCWDARRDTLCCAACRTCSSHVSCSLERSTLTISGTCGDARSGLGAGGPCAQERRHRGQQTHGP